MPAFTHNWLHLNAPHVAPPRRITWLDRLSVGFAVAFVVSVASGASSPVQGTIALSAAVFNAARLVLWKGFATVRAPIVWILHVGYAWVVVGLALSAASALGWGVTSSLAFHAFGVGAAGTMIMAVMSRASLGHTGRPLIAPPANGWAYYLVTLAALMRVAGPHGVASGGTELPDGLAALSWISAFTLFVAVYAPILTTPRVHTKVQMQPDRP